MPYNIDYIGLLINDKQWRITLIKITQAEEVFVTRALEERNFWSAAQYIMDMKHGISETSFLKQVNLAILAYAVSNTA